MKKHRNPHAVALAKLGGRKGGLARAASLTPEERSEIARKAAQALWKRRKAEAAAKKKPHAGGGRSSAA